MIKLLMCITLSETGGSQRVVYDILANLPEDKYDITMVTAPGGDLIDWVNRLNQCRKNVIRVITLSCIRRNISPVNDFVTFIRLLSLMRRSRFDVAHFHNSKVGLLGRAAAWLSRTPKTFYTVHGWGLNRSTTGILFPFLSMAERIVARMSTAVIFVSRSDMERGLQNKWAYKSNASLIYNGIADGSAPRERASGSEPVIIFVARLAEPKEPLLALQASEILQREGYAHRLLIVGDGPMYPDCVQYIGEHRLQNCAFMLGKRDDVRGLLESSDIFCLFSRWEGLPISILEAMAAGLPVVASAVGGIPEMVEHGSSGYLAEDFSAENTAEYIKTLIRDEGLRRRMGAAARAAVRERFALEDMVSKYRQLYETPYPRRGRRSS